MSKFCEPAGREASGSARWAPFGSDGSHGAAGEMERENGSVGKPQPHLRREPGGETGAKRRSSHRCLRAKLKKNPKKAPQVFAPPLRKLLQRQRAPQSPLRHCGISTGRASCFPQRKTDGFWCKRGWCQPGQDSPRPNQPRRERAEPDSPPPVAGEDLGRTYRSARPRLLLFSPANTRHKGPNVFAGGVRSVAPPPLDWLQPLPPFGARGGAAVAIGDGPVLIWRLFTPSPRWFGHGFD